MWGLLDNRQAEYPAEHNVGHLYPAKAAMQAFYRALDPCNSLNPGIGQTSKCKHWHLRAPPSVSRGEMFGDSSVAASGRTWTADDPNQEIRSLPK